MVQNSLPPGEAVTTGSQELARKAVDIAADSQATDIRLLDMRELKAFADYFVILTAESNRQMASILEEMDAGLSGLGVDAHHHEGTPESGWVLLDYGDLIIHVFAPAQRDYFKLERLWAGAKTLIQIQ
jgi:ribosome-associated protein